MVKNVGVFVNMAKNVGVFVNMAKNVGGFVNVAKMWGFLSIWQWVCGFYFVNMAKNVGGFVNSNDYSSFSIWQRISMLIQYKKKNICC